MSELIIAFIVSYVIIFFVYAIASGSYAGHHYLNPLDNYEEWDKLNVFAVLVFTLLLNILFAPFAILYWIIKLLVFIFTVGRN